MTLSSNEKYCIEFANQQNRPVECERLVEAVSMVLADHQLDTAEISIALVDDATIREMNNSHLGHDYETDVLSFLLEYDPDREFLAGQLIVSTDTAATIAGELNISMADELLLYVVHGMLHLVAMDDTTPEQATSMREAEKFYLTALGVEYVWDNDLGTGEPEIGGGTAAGSRPHTQDAEDQI